MARELKQFGAAARRLLCLIGADVAASHWPEPRSGAWNRYAKDRFEGYASRHAEARAPARPDTLLAQ